MIKPFIRTLDNGLRVVCVEMPHLHSAELAVYLKVGGRNDPPGKEGLSHFLEHILFRGTADYASSQALENAFEAIGGAPNASTDADSTCYYSKIHPAHFRGGMEIFASMLMRPTLEGVEVEKRIITEEAREDLNEQGEEINPDTIASRLLWPDHPLGMPTIGTLASIASTSAVDLRSHLERFYVPSGAVVSVAGPVDHDQVFDAAAAIFGGWGNAQTAEINPVTVRHSTPQICFVHDSDSQMTLQIAFLGLARSDRRFMALRLIRRILAGGGSSRLHLRLREELGIVYSVEAAIGAYDESGCLSIDLSTAPETLPLAVEVTLKEIATLLKQPIPEGELNRVRQAYGFDLEFSRDSACDMAGRYGWGELMGVVRHIEEDLHEAEQLTTTDIMETARDIFTPANLRLVVVGPWKEKMKRQIQGIVDQFAPQA